MSVAVDGSTLNLEAEKFVDNLLSSEASETPSDNVKPDELVMELPKWFDEEKYNRGRKFYQEFCFSFSVSMLMGLVSVLAVPSILRILVNTRRSNSTYTAYKRYVSTFLHTLAWFDHELKPGTLAWKSLFEVRSRHLRAGLAAKAKGIGVVSQRDVALTQFGFFGFAMLKPDEYSLRPMQEGDWEAYNHVWRVIGYMIGLEDRYNICRDTVEETLEVCRLLMARVFTPCLENPPEHFEHTARVMLDGLWCVNPTIDVDAAIWKAKYLADVPGYVYSESDRRKFQAQLREKMDGNVSNGIDVTKLMEKPAIEGLPDLPPRLLYYNDYNCLETIPTYQELTAKSKYKLYLNNLYFFLYGSLLGRWYFNVNFKFSLYLVRYFPYLAFFRFGVKASLVNMFEEDPKDDTKVKLNAEYKGKKELSWYEWLFAIFW